ncbi:MAG: hypothetical protein ACTHJS_03125 [Xanthobacteraceae bacterium]|jgi:hypothetical protein
MGVHAMQELTDAALDVAPDQTEYCVSQLTLIARAEQGVEQKLRDAETQISDLLLANERGWFIILQLLIERLRSELNRHEGSTREFLTGVIEFIDRHLERARAA